MAYTDTVGGILTQAYVSGFSLHKPEKYNELFLKHGKQGIETFQLFRSMGFEEPVASDEYSHFEDRDMHQTIKINAQVLSPGVGAAGTYRLHADSLYGSSYQFYPKVGMGIIFPNKEVGQITGITGTGTANVDLTIAPRVVLNALPDVEALDSLVIFDNAFAEGTTQPSGHVTGADEITNYLQIFKVTDKVTGSEMANQSWVQKDSAGRPIGAWYYRNQMELDYRMALLISGALTFGKATTNTAITGTMSDGSTTAQVKTTNGLWTAASTYGNTHNYTAGNFQITADLDEIARIQASEFITGGYSLFGMGLRLYQDVENAAYEYLKNATDFSKQAAGDIFGGNEALALSVGFQGLKKSGVTYLLKLLGEFSNPNLYGVDSAVTKYEFDQKGIIIPLNKGKDAKSGKMIDSIGTRYKKLNGYDRMMRIWELGSQNVAVPTSAYDEKTMNMLAHVGCHTFGANRFIIVEPS